MMRSVCILVLLLLPGGRFAFSAAQADAANRHPFAGTTQLIVVVTSNWDGVQGQLQRFERSRLHKHWRPIGEPIPIVVGRNGLGWGIGLAAANDPNLRFSSDPVKKEGDGKSPAGIFDLGTVFGYSDQPLPRLKFPYLTLTESIECVDDVNSKYYNRIVDRSAVAADWNSSEHMRDVGESYRWGMVVDLNATIAKRNQDVPEPGGGSCVFLHIWQDQNHGTAGCTAMTQTNLQTLLTWLDPKRRPLLLQLPVPAYERLAHRWKLPKLSNAPVR
ncbi:MAG: L,D-transpeptidase family protein [Terracidiphilus sp.]|jgi:D-alanyl-D-alanine dipeptidase